jgi:cytochrome c peroxidase
MVKNRVFISIFLVVLFCGCKEEKLYTVVLPPKHFPVIHHEPDNELTDARVDLGKRLFFSTIFSVDSSISCGSCHKPELAFTDGLPKSNGVKNRTTFRNAPSLFNVAYETSLMRDGGIATLELQVAAPVHEPTEFDFNMVLIVERMLQDSMWVQLSKKAYNRTPDPFVITRALSAFQRTLFSGSSLFDDYLNGNDSVFSENQRSGFRLFISNCASCHSGMFFTNGQFANNGLYEVYQDSGRMRITLNAKDRALFKVPSLRNSALTAPYMHDGSMSTLREVIEHYNSGGKKHPHQHQHIKPLQLTQQEIENLEAFLHTLTDKKAVDFYNKTIQ